MEDKRIKSKVTSRESRVNFQGKVIKAQESYYYEPEEMFAQYMSDMKSGMILINKIMKGSK